MNQLLFWVESQGLNSFLYDLFFFLGWAAMIAFCFWNVKNYKLPMKKAIPFTFIVDILCLIWMFLLFWVESGFKSFGGNNIVRIFIWVPIFAWPLCKWMKLDFNTMCDYAAPTSCISQGIGHLGCIFGGCCHGFPWEHGVYNHILHYKTFPIQPIEALVAISIALFICLKQKKQNYKVTGEYYPLMLILFGYSRFLLEFARDNEKLFLGISNLAIHALIMGIVGTIWLIVRQEKNRAARKH